MNLRSEYFCCSEVLDLPSPCGRGWLSPLSTLSLYQTLGNMQVVDPLFLPLHTLCRVKNSPGSLRIAFLGVEIYFGFSGPDAPCGPSYI